MWRRVLFTVGLLFLLSFAFAFAFLAWLAQKRAETFVDLPDGMDLKDLPDPALILKKVRAMLDSIDKPSVWGHAASVMDKDPGQLARMYLDEQRSKS